MANIFHQVLIQAPIEKVYDAVTSQRGLSSWWIADCTVRPEVGFVNEFRVHGYGVNRMKVIALAPAEFVAWECLNEGDAWSGTRISFTLSTRGEYTCLNFRHTGYREEDEIYATCNYHWARHLTLLKGWCETGISTLNPGQEQKEVNAVHGAPRK